MPRNYHIRLRAQLSSRKLNGYQLQGAYRFSLLLLGWWGLNIGGDSTSVHSETLEEFLSGDFRKRHADELTQILDKNNNIPLFSLFASQFTADGYSLYAPIVIQFVKDRITNEEVSEFLIMRLRESCSIPGKELPGIRAYDLLQMLERFSIETKTLNLHIRGSGLIFFGEAFRLDTISVTIIESDPHLLFEHFAYKSITGMKNLKIIAENPLAMDYPDNEEKSQIAILFTTEQKEAVIPDGCEDFYNTGNRKTVSLGETLLWRRVSLYSGQVIIYSHLPPFSRGVLDRNNRKKLANSHWIKEIVLVKGSEPKRRSPLNQIIYMDKSRKHEEIHFVDSSSTEDIGAEANDEKLNVTLEEVEKNDFSLLVSQYLINESTRPSPTNLIGRMTFNKLKTITIGSMCQVIQPRSLKEYPGNEEAKGNGQKVYVLKSQSFVKNDFTGSADILEGIGGEDRLKNWEGCVRVDPKKEKLIEQFRIKPLDIVVSTRGAIGEIAIISPNFHLKHPGKGKSIPVVASQTSQILRFNNPEEKLVIHVFMHLSSEEGRRKLMAISGNGKTYIKPQALKLLKIPFFEEENTQNISLTISNTYFIKAQNLARRIRNLERELQETANFDYLRTYMLVRLSENFIKASLTQKDIPKGMRPITEGSYSEENFYESVKIHEIAEGTEYNDYFIDFTCPHWQLHRENIALRIGIEPDSPDETKAQIYWGITVYAGKKRCDCNNEKHKYLSTECKNIFIERGVDTDVNNDKTDSRFICSDYFQSALKYNFKKKDSILNKTSNISNLEKSIMIELSEIVKMIDIIKHRVSLRYSS